MDLCEDEDHVYVKIIDYKSGTTPLTWQPCTMDCSFSWWSIWTRHGDGGEETSGKEVVPAGIFYYHINDPMADKQEE